MNRRINESEISADFSPRTDASTYRTQLIGRYGYDDYSGKRSHTFSVTMMTGV